MPKVDESVRVENIGEKQNSFLNWLQDKLEDEMKKESYKHYVEQENYISTFFTQLLWYSEESEHSIRSGNRIFFVNSSTVVRKRKSKFYFLLKFK